VCREDLVFIAIDERLKNTFDVRANRGCISRAIIGGIRSFSHEKGQKTQNENRAAGS
jgi:hypothetical protein